MSFNKLRSNEQTKNINVHLIGRVKCFESEEDARVLRVALACVLKRELPGITAECNSGCAHRVTYVMLRQMQVIILYVADRMELFKMTLIAFLRLERC
jgi:hypothetical protein